MSFRMLPDFKPGEEEDEEAAAEEEDCW